MVSYLSHKGLGPGEPVIVGREGRGLADGHDELDDLEGLGVDPVVHRAASVGEAQVNDALSVDDALPSNLLRLPRLELRHGWLSGPGGLASWFAAPAVYREVVEGGADVALGVALDLFPAVD